MKRNIWSKNWFLKSENYWANNKAEVRAWNGKWQGRILGREWQGPFDTFDKAADAQMLIWAKEKA